MCGSMNLTRRQLQNLKVAVLAEVHGQLIKVQKFRDDPQLAASEAKRHADAAVKVNQRSAP